MTTSIRELDLMTETERLYRMNERLEEMYLSNADFLNALQCKWRMLVWQGGSL